MNRTAGAAEKITDALGGFSLGQALFSPASCRRLQLQFSEAGIRADSQEYLSGAALLSAAAAMAFLVALLLFASELLLSFGASLVLFAILFGMLFTIPTLLASRRREQAESELPFLLREFAIYLDVGLPFEQCMQKVGKGSYLLSQDFFRAHTAIKSGSTVQSSLAEIYSKYSSLSLKRSLLLLSIIYETGGSSEPLKRSSEELSATQLSRMRTQSGRLSMLAILFIATSALIPSFFMIFAAASPLVSPVEIKEWQVWLAFLLVFPLLNLAALCVMFFFLPAVPSNEADESQLEEYLKKKGFPYGKTAFAAAASMLALALAAFFLLLGQMPAAALSICIAPALYALVSYAASRGTAESEQFLPDALYSAASTHKLLSAEKMLAFLSRGGFGRLSEAFGLALRRQKAGESFAASMAAAARFCPSPLVRRSFSLLVVCYETGANMYFALREAASDVVSFFSLVRERAALLAIQRYTVLAASALLVPLILGTVASLAPALSSPSILSSGAASAPLSSLTAACQLYLIINSALSALLLSFAETSPGRAALYFALSAPISQLVFALAASGSLSLA